MNRDNNNNNNNNKIISNMFTVARKRETFYWIMRSCDSVLESLAGLGTEMASYDAEV
jgi:hypothetical protein